MPTDQSKQQVRMTFDLRIVVAVLVVIIIAMLFWWRPWSPGTGTRTINVTGETTISATPDEFVFMPSYQFVNADKTTALADITKRSEEIVAKLKELGVPESGIKTNTSNYQDLIYRENETSKPTYTLQLTVTVSSLELAQKVQDYLVTTAPTGSVSPQPSFSDAKRKEIEGTARDQATQDARAKAEQTAKNLGFKLGKVQSVTDGSGFNGIPYATGRAAAVPDSAKSPSLSIQPGENKLTYSVTVVYYIR